MNNYYGHHQAFDYFSKLYLLSNTTFLRLGCMLELILRFITSNLHDTKSVSFGKLIGLIDTLSVHVNAIGILASSHFCGKID